MIRSSCLSGACAKYNTVVLILNTDEVVTGGPVTLNPIPLRKGPLRPNRTRNIDMDPGDTIISLKNAKSNL